MPKATEKWPRRLAGGVESQRGLGHTVWRLKAGSDTLAVVGPRPGTSAKNRSSHSIWL